MRISFLVKGAVVCFLGGVTGATFFRNDLDFQDWKAVIVMILFVVVVVVVSVLKKNLALCFMSFFILGVFRLLIAMQEPGISDIAYYANDEGHRSSKVTVLGQICAEVDIRADKQYFLLCADKISFSEVSDKVVSIPVNGRVLVKVKKYPVYKYGDRVGCQGRLVKPMSFEGFDYASFLGKDDIYAVMYSPTVRVSGSDIVGGGLGPAFWLKGLIRDRVETIFSEPSASLVLGLLLGVRTSIPQEILDNFQIAGLTHILAISGYNITLIITIFALMLKNGGRRSRFVITVLGIIVFAILTGMSASVIRASVMGVITVIALYVGRKSNGVQALLMSVFLMVMVNPKILVYDISFQLSFLSTAGLLVLLPLVTEYIKKLPALIGEGLVVTLSATIFTLPITLFNFHSFSIISPLANVIFLPLIPLIMMSSFAALVVSLIFPSAGIVVGALTWIGSFLLIEGVAMVAQIPYALTEVLGFNEVAFVVYYFVLYLVIIAFRRSRLDKIFYPGN